MDFRVLAGRGLVLTDEAIEKAATDQTWADAVALIERRYGPKISAAFQRSMQDAQKAVDLKALAVAIARHDAAAVLAACGLAAEVLPGLVAMIAPIQDAAVEAGIAQLAQPGFSQLRVVFDRMNPAVVQHFQTYRMNLIQQVSNETRRGIEETVRAGVQAGINPRQIAIQTRKTVGFGLTAQQARAVQNFRAELEAFHLKRSAEAWGLGKPVSRAPGGAQTMALASDKTAPLDDILARRLRDFRFDRTLQRALRTGEAIPADKINLMVDRYMARMAKHRAEMIARTEAIRGAAVGQQSAIQQLVQEGGVPAQLVRRRWNVAKDERTCKICVGIAKANPDGVGLNQAFAVPGGNPITIPPAHPNCRCVVTSTLRLR